MRKAIGALVLTALATAAVGTTAPRVAQAQTVPDGHVNALPQGMIGTGLLGAEAVIIIESVAGVHNRWILLGTGLIGLAGGVVGGYFIDHAIDTANNPMVCPGGHCAPTEVSSALLIVGAGLIIPAAIAYAGATMYRPEDHTNNATDDNAATAAPLEESTGGANSTGTGAGSSSGAAATSGAPPSAEGGGAAGVGRGGRRLLGPEAFLNVRPGRLRLGIPSLTVANSFTLDEMRQFGIAPQTEYHVPLFSAVF